MEYVVVTAKIPVELKEKAKKYGIVISKFVREALEKEVKKREEEEYLKALKTASKVLSKIDASGVVESVREDRDSR